MPIGCLVFGFGELDIPGDWFLAPGDISINGDTHSQLTAANVTKEEVQRQEQHNIKMKSTAQRENKESCQSCLYTGVATCIGLSGYFFYLATEEDTRQPNKKQQHPSKLCSNKSVPKSPTFPSIKSFMQGKPIPKRNRPFLFAASAVWAVAGAYRVYLE